ncbi:MAG: T9SS type A sorting domain-containing protein, partial [Brumimicrobium sp.]|nr:T9SS type A sorting domain-containing protein [Brumimicrobium sp.]
YNYQKVMISYIKDSLNWNRQLIGINIKPPAADKEHGNNFDTSIYIANIDVIGFNPYYVAPNALLKSANNNMYKMDVDTVRFTRGIRGLPRVPVIISEGGINNEYSPCSNFDLRPVDEMTLGFTGIAGFLFWDGRGKNVDSINNLYLNLWKNTFRALNHMNGDDVIGTLSQGGGYWEHGAQQRYFQSKKKYDAQAVEMQTYISNNKEVAVGYIRNRTYNVYTRGLNNSICNDAAYNEIDKISETTPLDQFYIFKWDAIETTNRIKVEKLLTTKKYDITFLNNNGQILETDTKWTSSGKLKLRYPFLDNNNPVIWFVARKKGTNEMMLNNMQEAVNSKDNLLDLLEQEDISNHLIDELYIYPNPFQEYIKINSHLDDTAEIRELSGRVVLIESINEGISELSTQKLVKGIYFIHFQNQNKTFKIIKL